MLRQQLCQFKGARNGGIVDCNGGISDDVREPEKSVFTPFFGAFEVKFRKLKLVFERGYAAADFAVIKA